MEWDSVKCSAGHSEPVSNCLYCKLRIRDINDTPQPSQAELEFKKKAIERFIIESLDR